MDWHLVTSEYPPQVGGVGDYAALLAAALAAAGDRVQVWCPPAPESGEPAPPGVEVRRELGRFAPADLRRAGRALDHHPRPRRLLVQWVPHGYGFRALNLAFCLWIWSRARRRGDLVELMVHEPFLSFERLAFRRVAAALVQRLMMAVLLAAAGRVWLAIPAWERLVRPWGLGRRILYGWLPLPSTLPVVDDPEGTAAVRRRQAPAGPLVGHFGTFQRGAADLLATALPVLMAARPDLSVLLLGSGGEALCRELIAAHPSLAGRVHAAGPLDAADLSRHLAACDLMLQPYPDGVSSRRTTAMACLAHGRPLVTTGGRLTEGLWAESGAVAIVPAGEPERLAAAALALLADPAAAARLGERGRELYRRRFDLARTVAALRAGEASR